MHHNFNFKDVLASLGQAAWQIEDVLPAGAELDFGRRFLPEALARTAAIAVPERRRERASSTRSAATNIWRCSAWSRSSSCPSCSTMPGRS